MKRHTLLIIVLTTLMAMIVIETHAKADRLVTISEMNIQKSWIKSHLTINKGQLPFSFICGNENAAALLAKMSCKTVSKTLSKRSKEQTITWTGAKGLKITLKCIIYEDYPALEWTLYLKNEGTTKSPVISALHAIDTEFRCTEEQPYTLHTNEGDYCAATSYRPTDFQLNENQEEIFNPDMGKSCNGSRGWPYYNIETAGNGIIMAIGWPGQWESHFVADKKKLSTSQLVNNSFTPP